MPRVFLWNLCLFLAPVLLLLIVIERRMTMIPNAYTYKQAALEAQASVTEAIVVGSSHEFEGVNTDMFSRPSFNLAMPSQSLSQSSEIALKYLEVHRQPGQATGAVLALPRLRYVLLGVSYFSLPYRMSAGGDDRLGFYMRTLHVFGDTTFRDLVNPSNYLYMGIYGWPAVQSMIRDHVPDYVGKLHQTGSMRSSNAPPPDAAPTSFAATAAARALYHQQIALASSIPLNLAEMRRLARECHAKGVALVLFTSPVTKEYAEAFGEGAWIERRSTIEAFAREFSVPYTDFSRSQAFGWRDFSNADHLNEDGAARFGRILSDTLFLN
jgi:hypothetical protein